MDWYGIFGRFLIFYIWFERFLTSQNWQNSTAKIVDWDMSSGKKTYTTWKSILSSFKIRFQNHGKLKRWFLRSQNVNSTFMKFELCRNDLPSMKTYHVNTSEQHSFKYISNQAPPHIYKTILSVLLSFLRKK